MEVICDITLVASSTVLEKKKRKVKVDICLLNHGGIQL
jgi:hypothetical protein